MIKKNQIQNINTKNLIDFKRASNLDFSNKSEYILDIHDSGYYREFLKSLEGSSLINGYGFKVSISTDGVNPSDKSKIS